ncbi:BTAD domain-containing putative transcriptional regulator [Streptomyces acidicola]|uniref:AfsR/SARP family transcriptional regulator n=1 Tax=Streptomyces acidicola TaxID=2596892 RepID=UPI0037A9225F
MSRTILDTIDPTHHDLSQHPAVSALEVPPLRFSLLGPLRAWRGGEAVPLGSPQQQAVLAALLLRWSRPATAEELIRAVWACPPGGAASVLRTYISKLRTALAAPHERVRRTGVLRSVSSGYALELPDTASDIGLLEQELAQARAQRDDGHLDEARRLLLRALGRWNGSPLSGVPGPLAEAERERLAELRLTVQESGLRLDLELGGHQHAIPELLRLTAAHPLREGLRHLLMIALYRCGRRAEALAVYDDTRRVLQSELAVGPGASLEQLRNRILAADPGLETLAEPGGPTPTGPPAKRNEPLAQLPTDLPDFTGRVAETDALVAALSAGPGVATRVAVVTGMGGVGKTSLAVHAAHKLAPAFPDGQLHVDLEGLDKLPTTPHAVLARFLRTLGEPVNAIPRDPAERAALFRTLISGRRMLLVLDNARDAEHVRHLLPGSPHCAVLVTSRARLGSLPTTIRIPLEVPPLETAVESFTRITGTQTLEADIPALHRLGELIGQLPLAVRILASRHAARPGWAVTQTVGVLEDDQRRLGALEVEDLSVRASFELGYNRLDDGQARAFLLPAQAGLRSFTIEEAAVLLDEEPGTTRRSLEALVDVGLLESLARDRYRYHVLLYLFARSRHSRQ